MIDTLLQPFTYGYMINAIWVSALVGGVCAFLSAYLMLKGWSLIGDALSHSIVPGVAGATMAHAESLLRPNIHCNRSPCSVLVGMPVLGPAR